MLKTLTVAARDRRRLTEISTIVARFGLGALLARFGLAGFGSGRANSDGERLDEADTASLPRRTRLALESLGPTFIKIGQILSTRSDLLPDEWVTELSALQGDVATVPFDILRSQLEDDLGQTLEAAFATFDQAPLAAASIAQVHRATLHSGEEVVIKVRRPGVEAQMQADLRILTRLAAVATDISPAIARHRPEAMLRDLSGSILEELDFSHEARNIDRFAANFVDAPNVVIPRVYWAFTSERVLVEDYIDGLRPTDAEALRAAGLDPSRIAANGADIVLDMVLIHGLFHGDPHPGNLICLSGDRIGLIDFGLVGQVSPRRREEVIAFIQSLTGDDAPRLAETLRLWSTGSGLPPERYLSVAETLIARHGGGRLVLSALIGDVMRLMRQEHLSVPGDLALIFKALLTLDGVLGRIDPDFDLTRAADKAGSRIMAHRYSPDAIKKRLRALALQLDAEIDHAPELIRALVARLRETPEAQRQADQLARQKDREALARGARWIAAAIFGAGLLVATALLLR